MAPKFGTSGLRGLVTELTDELCARYTRAFLSVTPHGGTLLVACDLRPSSRQHLRAVAAGARALGVNVIDCGEIATPALALEGLRQKAPAVMVTGSHIPADRNGLKFYTATGEITKDDEMAILAALVPWDGPMDLSDPLADTGTDARYIDRFTGFFAPGALSGLTVGVYEHSAVGRDSLSAILRALGAIPRPLGRSDTFIPVDTEAVPPATRVQLAEWAAGGDLDAIVSLDGDSDRPLVTDATGTVIPGDIIGALTARHLGATAVVTPVSSNTMVERMGFATTRTGIGSPHVIAGIETVLAGDPLAKVVGYEANGGFLTGFTATSEHGTLSPLMTRDAVLPILCALSAVPLAATMATLPPRRTAADRAQGVPTDVSQALIADLTASAESRAAMFPTMGTEAGIDLTDGLRITFDSGEILHLRPSGNAPELRCYAEAASSARAKEIVADALARILRHVG